MNRENKTILLNQLRIMSAMQRLEYFVHQEAVLEDLSEGIKDTQKILNDDMDNEISIKQEKTNLKQALNEIKEYVKSDKALIGCDENDKELFLRDYICCNKILQIIDKVGGNE